MTTHQNYCCYSMCFLDNCQDKVDESIRNMCLLGFDTFSDAHTNPLEDPFSLEISYNTCLNFILHITSYYYPPGSTMQVKAMHKSVPFMSSSFKSP